MFDLADAMAKAYQKAIVKKNPRKGAKKTLNILSALKKIRSGKC